MANYLFLLGAGFNADAKRAVEAASSTEYPLVPQLARICFDAPVSSAATSIEELFQQAMDRRDFEPVKRLIEVLMRADHDTGGALTRAKSSIYGQFVERHAGVPILTFDYDCLLELLLFARGMWRPEDGFGVPVIADQEAHVGPKLPAKSVTNVLHLHGSLSALAVFQRRLSDQIGDATALKDSLITWIGEVCLRFDRKEALEIYGDIVPSLAALEIPVFTTNYDGVFDHVAEAHGIAVADNFKADSRGRKFWDPTHNSFGASGLRLIKMHGSIYWHATEGNGTIEKMIQPGSLNAEGEAVTQLLIFPTRFKDIYQQNYFPLYSAFTRTLGNASNLVLVGHSLRDEYLLAAVRERLKDPTFALIVVDIHLPRALKGLEGNVLHLDGGVKKYMPLLKRAVADHHDQDTFYAYLSEARSAVKRGRTEKISVAGVPQRTEPGATLDLEVTLSTLIGTYSWIVGLVRVGKTERLYSSTKAEAVIGYGEDTKKVRIRLPKDLEAGPAYPLSFELVNEQGRVVARERKNLRIRRS